LCTRLQVIITRFEKKRLKNQKISATQPLAIITFRRLKVWVMKEIETGATYQVEEVVTPEKSASMVGSGLLDVYSTPAMIALMEKASFLCVEKYLDEGESTVGGGVNIRHLKPTAIGKKVICISTVKSAAGKRIDFDLAVSEDGIPIGNGIHTRFVIDKVQFLKNL
jgi:fluoroacetyl-CoA thioesterase